ncbi:AAA family ATPase [Wielerella bovis]|uniref:AAA family ATPase n=1 Tax=Wielerella bovis TaxID=2917790 RepID=UPI0020197ADC|nr:AAA family ATPase [Wielerella bovis]ULJ62022.1 AAA family ATPase [Wielerella bovis]
MKIQSMTLKNVGHFKDLTIPFAPLEEGKPRVTVFIGNNGSGKTNILKSLVTALSWLPARMRTERGRGLDIPEEVIHNDEHSAAVSVNVWAHNQEFVWTLGQSRKLQKKQITNDVKQITELVDFYREPLFNGQEMNLPAIIFYPVERTVLKTDLAILDKPLEQIDAYDVDFKTGVDFQPFFKWFRNEEDIENEKWKQIVSNNLRAETELKGLPYPDRDSKLIARKSLALNFEDLTGNLHRVRYAIQQFTGLENIRIQRIPLQMLAEKNGKTFSVSQLSQGEKSLMALVGDIARRLVMLNPNLENPLEGQGVIMIDEADLHLHPQWQRQLIDRLTKTFPNCQFILSTHSPLVISDSKDIVVYSLENGEMSRLPSQYGQDANSVLLGAMDTDERNSEVRQKLNQLFLFIQDNELDKAKNELTALQGILPNNILELSQAQLLIKKQELRNEINQKKQQ